MSLTRHSCRLFGLVSSAQDASLNPLGWPQLLAIRLQNSSNDLFALLHCTRSENDFAPRHGYRMMFRLPKSLSTALRTHQKISKLFEVRRPRRGTARSPKQNLDSTLKFGSNPGGLRMKTFVPPGLLPKSPLVVVLHGCRQTPESLDAAAGFTRLAKARGFVTLFPEQTKSNNPQGCFNWFRPSAVARDRGELLSIRQMIEQACKRHRVDRSRIFVVGLSAGAAMAAALVANYPELFAGAAMVAGNRLASIRRRSPSTPEFRF